MGSDRYPDIAHNGKYLYQDTIYCMECILSGGGVLCDLKMTGILVVSLRLRNCRFWSHVAVADADLQISGVGGGHPDLRYGGGGGGGVSKKIFFGPLGLSFI